MSTPVDIAAVEEQLRIAPLHRELDVRIVSMTTQQSEFTARVGMEWTNDGKSQLVHGGMVAALLDMAADWSLYPAGLLGVAIDLHTNFLRATPPGELRIVGTPVKLGRTVSVARAELIGAGDKLLATAIGTYTVPRAE